MNPNESTLQVATGGMSAMYNWGTLAGSVTAVTWRMSRRELKSLLTGCTDAPTQS